MLLTINNVLSPEDVTLCRAALESASWADGNITSGFESARAKKNHQLPGDSPVALKLGELILQRLSSNAVFITAALPNKVFPPLFNCYSTGMSFGNHIDNSIRDGAIRIRTDLSATLFLSEPDEYEGGELVIEDWHGTQSIKLNAGSLVLYPASSLHRVTPITQGTRLASFFWIQSMVRAPTQRHLLLQMDLAIQGMRRKMPEAPELLSLAGCYHNLLREWAEV